MARRIAVIGIAILVVAAGGIALLSSGLERRNEQQTPTNVASTPNVQQPAVAVTSSSNDCAIAAMVNRDFKVPQRISSDISAKIPTVRNPDDFPALVQCLTDATDDDTVRNEVANLLARSNYPGMADALIKVLDNPNEKPRFRAFATQHLGQRVQSLESGVESQDAGVQSPVVSKLQSLLSDKDVEVRREALLALARQKDEHGIQKTLEWLNDSSADANKVRDLAIRCAHDLDMRDQIPVIRKYVRDPNEVIRIAAIVALSQWADEESRPAFEEAAKSTSVRLQRAGKAALQRLDNSIKTQATETVPAQ